MQGDKIVRAYQLVVVLFLAVNPAASEASRSSIVDSASFSRELRGASLIHVLRASLVKLDARDFRSAISVSERTVEITTDGADVGVLSLGSISDALYVGDGGRLKFQDIQIQGLAVPNGRGSALDDFMLSPSIQIGPGSRVELSRCSVALPRPAEHADCHKAQAALAAWLSTHFRTNSIARLASGALHVADAVEARIAVRSYGHTVGHSTLAIANSTLQCQEPHETGGSGRTREQQRQGGGSVLAATASKLQEAARQVFGWQAATAAMGTAFALAATAILGLLLARSRAERRHEIALSQAQATRSSHGESVASLSSDGMRDLAGGAIFRSKCCDNGSVSDATVSPEGSDYMQQLPARAGSGGSITPSVSSDALLTRASQQADVSGSGGSGDGDARHAITQDSVLRDQHSHLMRMRMEGGLEGIEIGPPLGAGSYGKVYKGRWQGVLVAIKVIEHKPVGSALEVEGARESLLAASISHPNVCACYKICNVLITQQPSRRSDTDADGFAIRPPAVMPLNMVGSTGAPLATAASGTIAGSSNTSSVASIAEPKSHAGKQFAADIAASEAAADVAANGASSAEADDTADNVPQNPGSAAPSQLDGGSQLSAFAASRLGVLQNAEGGAAPLQHADSADESWQQQLAGALGSAGQQSHQTSSAASLQLSDGSFAAANVEVVDMQRQFEEAASASSSSDREKEESTETWMLLEYADRGSLEHAISSRRFYLKTDRSKLDMVAVCRTLVDIASGLVYLHSIGLMHGDLKPANVLLKSSMGNSRGFVAKLADFGMSRMLRGGVTHISTKSFGTVPFMAPELLRDSRMGKAGDVYSFGVLMWSLLSGQPLHTDMTAMQVMWGVVQSGLRPDMPERVPRAYAKIIKLCWAESPADRPTAAQLSDLLQSLLEAELKGRTAARQDSSLEVHTVAESPRKSIDTPRGKASLRRAFSSGTTRAADSAATSTMARRSTSPSLRSTPS